MSLQFWVVIKLLYELINWYTFGMWSYYVSVICQNTSGMLSHHWHIGILGLGPAVWFTVMSLQMWDVILLYVSLICQYTSRCDASVRFTDIISTLGGCDHTVGFIDTSLHFWNVILLCNSLVCWYTSTILHSIASQKTAISIVVNVGT